MTYRSVDDLIRIGNPTTKEEARVLRGFSEHYHTNPALLPFLVRHARKQVRRFGWVCFDAAWAAALMELRTPGGPDFKLPAKLKSWYVRGILYCHPDLNGCLGIHTAAPDSVFGMAVAKKQPGDYFPRLQWADGRPITAPPILKPVSVPVSAQGKLFTEAA